MADEQKNIVYIDMKLNQATGDADNSALLLFPVRAAVSKEPEEEQEDKEKKPTESTNLWKLLKMTFEELGRKIQQGHLPEDIPWENVNLGQNLVHVADRMRTKPLREWSKKELRRVYEILDEHTPNTRVAVLDEKKEETMAFIKRALEEKGESLDKQKRSVLDLPMILSNTMQNPAIREAAERHHEATSKNKNYYKDMSMARLRAEYDKWRKLQRDHHLAETFDPDNPEATSPDALYVQKILAKIQKRMRKLQKDSSGQRRMSREEDVAEVTPEPQSQLSRAQQKTLVEQQRDRVMREQAERLERAKAINIEREKAEKEGRLPTRYRNEEERRKAYEREEQLLDSLGNFEDRTPQESARLTASAVANSLGKPDLEYTMYTPVSDSESKWDPETLEEGEDNTYRSAKRKMLRLLEERGLDGWNEYGWSADQIQYTAKTLIGGHIVEDESQAINIMAALLLYGKTGDQVLSDLNRILGRFGKDNLWNGIYSYLQGMKEGNILKEDTEVFAIIQPDESARDNYFYDIYNNLPQYFEDLGWHIQYLADHTFTKDIGELPIVRGYSLTADVDEVVNGVKTGKKIKKI